MTSILNFHAFAATRGEGLHPELRALFERVAAAPHSQLTARDDGMIQSVQNQYQRRFQKSEETCRSFRKL